MDWMAQGVAAVAGQSGPIGWIGPVPVYLFGMTTALGVVVGLAAALLQADRFGLSLSRTFEGLVWAVMGGFVGARVGYVVVHWGDYRHASSSVFRLAEGGFLFHGALAFGLVALLAYGRFVRVDRWRVLDAAAPGLALGQAVGLVGAQVLGQATSLPWGVVVQETKIHPLPAYGSLLAYGLFYFIWRFGRGKVRPGSLFLTYLCLHGVGAWLLGFWSSARTYFGMTPTQWGGLLAALVAVVVMYVRRSEPIEAARPVIGAGWNTAKYSFGNLFRSGETVDRIAVGDDEHAVWIWVGTRRRTVGARLTEAALWLGGALLLMAGFAARL